MMIQFLKKYKNNFFYWDKNLDYILKLHNQKKYYNKKDINYLNKI